MTRSGTWKSAALAGCFLACFNLNSKVFAQDKNLPETMKPRELAMPLPKSMPKPDVRGNASPIDWPGVLELARASNLEIQIAQEKVTDANLQLRKAREHWIPSMKVGGAVGHREGRYQTDSGRIIDASASDAGVGGILSMKFDPRQAIIEGLKAKQQVYSKSGELDRITRQAVQEASLAYLDLVAAQAGSAIMLEISDLIGDILSRLEILEGRYLTAAEALLVRTQFQSQQSRRINSRTLQLAAGAKLVNLLNLDPQVRLYATDEYLIPVQLVDENRPLEELIAEAQSQGPGLAEVAAALMAIDEMERKVKKSAALPTFQLDAGGGTFGGGTGGAFGDFSDRSDVRLQVYWDLSNLVGTSTVRDIASSKRRQANLYHEQVMSRLATGIVVANDSAQRARDRITQAENELTNSIKSYELNFNKMVTGSPRPEAGKQSGIQEVLQAIASVGTARQNYLSAVIDYNRAQIQLQFLLGIPQTGGRAMQKDGVMEKSAPVR